MQLGESEVQLIFDDRNPRRLKDRLGVRIGIGNMHVARKFTQQLSFHSTSRGAATTKCNYIQHGRLSSCKIVQEEN